MNCVPLPGRHSAAPRFIRRGKANPLKYLRQEAIFVFCMLILLPKFENDDADDGQVAAGPGMILLNFRVYRAGINGLPAAVATQAGLRSNAMPHIGQSPG